MIAALAAGVLGQLQGLASISSGISSVSALFKGSNTDATATDKAATSSAATPQNGRTPALSTLSDQLQGLLLQQQSVGTPSPTVQADDVPATQSLA